MNELTDDNIAFIYSEVKAKGMTVGVLIDEMVDHICCTIEPELKKGISFDIAYYQLINQLDENVFRKIEKLTLLETNLKFQAMKKTMFSFGIIGTFFLLAGDFMKIMHYPGAGVVMFSGTVLILLLFLPLLFFTTFKEQDEPKNILLPITGYFTLLFVLAGSLFKVMHWPGANWMMSIGQVVLLAAFLPVYIVNTFRKANKTHINYKYLIIIIGIGLATVYMTYSVRPSREYIDKFDSINSQSEKTTKYFKVKCDSLFLQLSKSETTSQTKAMAERIKNQTEEISDFIEKAKSEILNNSKVRKNDDVSISQEIMMKYGNALKEKFRKLKETYESLPIKENRKIIIISSLNSLNEILYDYRFQKTPAIETLAILSSLQKDSRISEFQYFQELLMNK